ncbi:MAG: guanosine polyphosphate pyrophosphohydrolase [Bulleidia sp.]
MIQLTDYLYEGHTIIRILHRYSADLKKHAEETGNPVDLMHASFLCDLSDILEHNDFLTSQSQRIREFYKYMAQRYPFLAFTFRGRIKSLIRAEEKFNGYIVRYIYQYYMEHSCFPDGEMVADAVSHFRDLIAYRIVICMPKCHLSACDNRQEIEEKYLYEIANALPSFMEQQGFVPEVQRKKRTPSPLLNEDVRPYYRDYISDSKNNGYRSLHISFFDTMSKTYFEVQLRTKEMDDFAEIGDANHTLYEQRQQKERRRRDAVPVGACRYFDDAFERGLTLQKLNYADVDVNMFTALDQYRMNDGCGFVYGRLILPYEHLSGFQNDVID